MWIDCKERQPDKDGTYTVQMTYNRIQSMSYTVEGGWNTFRNRHNAVDGTNLDDMVYRWVDAGDPPMVTKREADEWEERCEH